MVWSCNPLPSAAKRLSRGIVYPWRKKRIGGGATNKHLVWWYREPVTKVLLSRRSRGLHFGMYCRSARQQHWHRAYCTLTGTCTCTYTCICTLYMYIIVAWQELGCMSCIGECIPTLVIQLFCWLSQCLLTPATPWPPRPLQLRDMSLKKLQLLSNNQQMYMYIHTYMYIVHVQLDDKYKRQCWHVYYLCTCMCTLGFFQLEMHGGIFHSCCSLTVTCTYRHTQKDTDTTNTHDV